MRLAGLQKTTLIDYPGKVSCVVFLSGCNFHCPYCHNPALAKGQFPNPISLSDLTSFLDQRRHLLDAVVISGGEPTLSPHIGDLCRRLRDLGLAIKLDTNGSRPEVLDRLISEGLIDYVAMDIKTRPQHYDAFCHEAGIGPLVRASIQCIMGHKDPVCDYEFRTTCVRPFVDDTVIDDIGCMIQGAALYVLQTFQTGELLDPDFGNSAANGYSVSEMTHLQEKAARWVRQCRIR